MNVYVASSWRNKLQPGVVKALREAGHTVYDFRNPRPGDHGFGWSRIAHDWQAWSPVEYLNALQHPASCAGFASDMSALECCDACVLVLPCGRSAHLEFGYAIGAGKLGIILLTEKQEPELMYAMATRICLSLDALISALA